MQHDIVLKKLNFDLLTSSTIAAPGYDCQTGIAPTIIRASDFFPDWWAEVPYGAKNGGSFLEMMGPSL